MYALIPDWPPRGSKAIHVHNDIFPEDLWLTFDLKKTWVHRRHGQTILFMTSGCGIERDNLRPLLPKSDHFENVTTVQGFRNDILNPWYSILLDIINAFWDFDAYRDRRRWTRYFRPRNVFLGDRFLSLAGSLRLESHWNAYVGAGVTWDRTIILPFLNSFTENNP